MDWDGWSGMFHECSFNNKYAFAISYLPLVVYNNITIIKYNSIEERPNGTKARYEIAKAYLLLKLHS